MNKKQFWQTYRHFLLEILRDRITISQQGIRPELQSLAQLYLDKIETNGYCNNREMSAFILSRKSVIIQLIPENESYQLRLEVFNQAIKEARQF